MQAVVRGPVTITAQNRPRTAPLQHSVTPGAFAAAGGPVADYAQIAILLPDAST